MGLVWLCGRYVRQFQEVKTDRLMVPTSQNLAGEGSQFGNNKIAPSSHKSIPESEMWAGSLELWPLTRLRPGWVISCLPSLPMSLDCVDI